MVEIVDLRQRMEHPAKPGMVDDIGDLLAVDPDIALTAKPLQELFARPCRHRISPNEDCHPTGIISARGGSITLSPRLIGIAESR